MDMINSKDSIGIEKNSRGFNFSVSIHSDDLLKEWPVLKDKLDSLVKELSEKYGQKND